MSDSSPIRELLKVPSQKRDNAWIRSFLADVAEERFWGNRESGIEGPDGLFYLALLTDKTDEASESLRLQDILEVATDAGTGVVINPQFGQPDWIFTFGQLWCLREFGSFFLEEEFSPVTSIPGEGTAVVDPTEEVLPVYVRAALKRLFKRALGWDEPGVMLIAEKENMDAQALAFSVFPESFKEVAHYEAILHMLDWHLPSHYGLRVVESDSELAQQFYPL